jgi:hypothetical protein
MRTHQKGYLCGQDAAHGMADEDDIGLWIFMGLEPSAKILNGNVDGLVGLVARVDL